MSDRSGGDQRQCRRGVTGDVELDAAMALANMAGAETGARAAAGQAHPVQRQQAPKEVAGHEHDEEEEELASTRLSLELGKVGIQPSSCSSSSSAGCPSQQAQAPVAAPAGGYGPRPRHALTEAEKEAKRLRRVLANRESARQTILRRQAIRDELARKVADLSSQNESMKKEKETVMQEYLSLKETNEQLKEQVGKASMKAAAPVTTTIDTAPPAQQAEAMPMPSTGSPPTAPTQPSFLYTAEPPAVPVPPYVWGSWAPGYEHSKTGAAAPAPPPLCLQPCAWYYPVVADSRGSPAPYTQPFQEPTSGGGGTAEEDSDDDSCSLTLALDVDKIKGTTSAESSSGRAVGLEYNREKASAAAEARMRRKELTKLKQMHAGGRPGDE